MSADVRKQEDYMGGSKMISLEFEWSEIWKVATGSFSCRLWDSSVPHLGILGIVAVAIGSGPMEFLSFGWIDKESSIRLPSRQLIPKLSNNDDALFSLLSGRS